MIKSSIQQEDINLVDIYKCNTGKPKYIKQILIDLNGEVNRNTILVGDFKTFLPSVDRSSRQKSTRKHQPSKTYLVRWI